MVDDKSKMDISIILPIYNERENLPSLMREIEQALSPLAKRYEVIAVDDGSKDGSREIIRELANENPHLKWVAFRRNMGQTAALSAGFRYALGEVIVTLDADCQNDPADIPRLLAKLEEGFDCVTGWRKHRRDSWATRKIPSRIANWFIRLMSGTHVRDLGCTLRAYRSDVLKELRLYGEMHRFLVVLVEGVGGRVAEIEVNHRPRIWGQSKYGLSRILKVPLDLLTIWFTHKYRTKPIYLFGGAGIGLLGLGGITAFFALYEKFMSGVWVHKNPIFILSVMFTVIGVLFLGMGLLAEILIRTYFESQNMQPYTVIESRGFGQILSPHRDVNKSPRNITA